MTNTAVVVPVAVLASICVCMFIFMFWIFPRYYKKGIAADMAEIDEVQRQRAAEILPSYSGENGVAEVPRAVVKPRGFVAPVTAY